MAEHTPGPWRVGPGGGCVVADAATGWEDRENLEDYEGHLVADSIRWESNARLIAAAPDLLAACRAMRATMYSADSEESKLADAAIARATEGD